MHKNYHTESHADKAFDDAAKTARRYYDPAQEALERSWDVVKKWYQDHGFFDTARNMTDLRRAFRQDADLAMKAIENAKTDLQWYKDWFKDNGKEKVGVLLYVW